MIQCNSSKLTIQKGWGKSHTLASEFAVVHRCEITYAASAVREVGNLYSVIYRSVSVCGLGMGIT